MKQPVELYHDFSRLSEYFKNIEILAERMGVNVDELISENQPSPNRLQVKRKVLYMSQGRKKMTSV